jgi:DNA-directed RNA polymerase II subunit RPB2
VGGFENVRNKTKININGAWQGFTDDPEDVYNYLKKSRRQGYISEEVSISRDFQKAEIKVMTDAGRCCRPLLVVKNNVILLKKEHLTGKSSVRDLVIQGLIEFLDVEEEESALIAMDPSYLEIE